MREPYEKPTIFFECFTLSQAIARPCAGAHPVGSAESTVGGYTHYSEVNCAWSMGNWSYFLSEPTCNMPTEPDDFDDEVDEDDPDAYCYNNPNPSMQVFSST